jgi:hypothetical protein
VVATAGGVVAAWAEVGRPPGGLPAGVLLLVAADRVGRLRLAAVVAAAVVIGWWAGVPGPTWVRLAVAATAVAGAMLPPLPPGTAAMLFAVACAGAWATVPDTELARALLGGAIAAATLAHLPVGRPQRRSMAPALAWFGWVVAVEGRGRPGAVVGGLACLGLLAVLPMVGRASARGWAVVAGQVAVVALAARLAGLRHDALPAAAIAVPLLAVTAAIARATTGT